jgi:hypothetical protein
LLEETTKRKKKSPKEDYYGPKVEEAVSRYMESDSKEEKNKIFEESLRTPFRIMVESIIHRYRLLRPGIDDSQELVNDATSFLLTKMDKFKQEKGKKSYSYFGTIVRNWGNNRLSKIKKERLRTLKYEDFNQNSDSRIEDRIFYTENYGEQDDTPFIDLFISKIDDLLKSSKDLTESDRKVGEAMKLLIKYVHVLIDDQKDYKSKKIFKQAFMTQIRDITRLKDREINTSLNKFKDIYKGLLD